MSAALEQILAATRARYAEPQRHYHGAAHLDALLALFEQHKSALHDAEAVRLAIYYHDAIYRPERADNETASAQLLRDELQGLVGPVTLDRAATLILATRSHHVPAGCEAELSADCARFLDMDVSVLGAAAEIFDGYEAGIAAEYRPHYAEEAYRQGRVKVLQHFLARDRIYVSAAFSALEAPARENLARSIAALSPSPASRERGGEGSAEGYEPGRSLTL